MKIDIKLRIKLKINKVKLFRIIRIALLLYDKDIIHMIIENSLSVWLQAENVVVNFIVNYFATILFAITTIFHELFSYMIVFVN